MPIEEACQAKNWIGQFKNFSVGLNEKLSQRNWKTGLIWENDVMFYQKEPS